MARLLKHHQGLLSGCLGGFSLGAALAAMTPGHPVFAVLGPWVLITLGWVLASERVARWALMLGCLCVGGAYYELRHFQPPPLPEGPVVVHAVVRSVHPTLLDVFQIDGQPVSSLRVRWSQSAPIGSTLAITGTLTEPFSAALPGTFNAQAYWASQGVAGMLRRTQHVSELSADPPNIGYAVLSQAEDWRSQIEMTYRQALPPNVAAVLGGVVLGDRAIPAPKNIRDDFLKTGLVHVLAASGMNVGIVGMGLIWLTRRWTHWRVSLLLAMVGVSVYCLMTGLPPSIQRAGTMFLLALALKCVRRSLSPVVLLLAATVFLIVLSPQVVTMLGFQLSVITTLAILVFTPLTMNRFDPKLPRWLTGAVTVPLAAQLSILPLTLSTFQTVPLHSVLMNLLGLWLIPPITIIGFASGLIALCWPMAGQLISTFAYWPVVALTQMAHWGAQWPNMQWTTPAPGIAWTVGAFTVMALTLVRQRLRPQAILTGLILLTLTFPRPEKAFQVWALPLKHPVWVATQGSQAALLAPTPLAFWEKRALEQWLKRQGLTHTESLPHSQRLNVGPLSWEPNGWLTWQGQQRFRLLSDGRLQTPSGFFRKALYRIDPSGKVQRLEDFSF
jgi:ComEC/Rec2-related protein